MMKTFPKPSKKSHKSHSAHITNPTLYYFREREIYLFLKIEGLLLKMKYAEYCRNPQNLYLLRVTPVCLNFMMSFAVWLVYFAVYVNCVSQVTLCRSVLCRESVRSSGHFTGCRQKKKINR